MKRVSHNSNSNRFDYGSANTRNKYHHKDIRIKSGMARTQYKPWNAASEINKDRTKKSDTININS